MTTVWADLSVAGAVNKPVLSMEPAPLGDRDHSTPWSRTFKTVAPKRIVVPVFTGMAEGETLRETGGNKATPALADLVLSLFSVAVM
jgi:hypothetical protein